MKFRDELIEKLKVARNPAFTEDDKNKFKKLARKVVEDLGSYAYIGLSSERELYLSLSTAEGLQYLKDEGFYVQQEPSLLLVYWEHAELEAKPEPIEEPVVIPEPIDPLAEQPKPEEPAPEAPVTEEPAVEEQPVPEGSEVPEVPADEPIVPEAPSEEPVSEEEKPVPEEDKKKRK